MEDINISGIPKAAILAALYNASKPLGLGFMHYDPTPMTEQEAEQLLKEQTYFDYVKGRVMKINLESDVLWARNYDRDNGEGAAGTIISALRNLHPLDSQQTS